MDECIQPTLQGGSLCTHRSKGMHIHIHNGCAFIHNLMALTPTTDKKWIAVVIKLSRKAYFPGAVVSGVMTVKPVRDDGHEEYLSFISAQVRSNVDL